MPLPRWRKIHSQSGNGSQVCRSPGGERSTAKGGMEARCAALQVEKDPQPKWEWKPGVTLSRWRKIHSERGNGSQVCRSPGGERSTAKVGMEARCAALQVEKDPQRKGEWKPGVPLSRWRKIHSQSGNGSQVCRSPGAKRSTAKVGMEARCAALQVGKDPQPKWEWNQDLQVEKDP